MQSSFTFRRGLGGSSHLSSFKSIENPCGGGVQFLGHVLATPWTATRQASLSITNSQSSLRLMSIELVMLSNHLILRRPLSCLRSFPASGSFPVSQLFASGGQSINASALVFPMNTELIPVGLTTPIVTSGLEQQQLRAR